MILQIRLCLKHSGRVSGRHQIVFSPGLNIVIGPNGSGKTSLLEAIRSCPDCVRKEHGSTKYHYFNSETMNPHNTEDGFRGIAGSIIRVRAMFSSHGETMRDVLRYIPFRQGDCLLLDEPESGQDFEWVRKIRKGLELVAKRGTQIVVATHHPVFWEGGRIIELKKGYRVRTLKSYRGYLSVV